MRSILQEADDLLLGGRDVPPEDPDVLLLEEQILRLGERYVPMAEETNQSKLLPSVETFYSKEEEEKKKKILFSHKRKVLRAC